MRGSLHSWLCTGLILLLVFVPAAGGTICSASPRTGSDDMVVWASPADPYYALAQEIAEQEGLPIVHALEDVIDRAPTFLLWVVSPPRLSAQMLVDYSRAVRDHQQAIAMGIISGSTIDRARDLWRRAAHVDGQQTTMVNGANPSASIFGGRIVDGHQPGETRPLNWTDLRSALTQADYLTFTGHGGRNYWRLDEERTLGTGDVPALPSSVVSSGGYQTFRPWETDSIALRFVDQGAAAYVGVVFSPNEGYVLGAFDGLPVRHTWPDVPIGLVVEVLKRGAVRGLPGSPSTICWMIRVLCSSQTCPTRWLKTPLRARRGRSGMRGDRQARSPSASREGLHMGSSRRGGRLARSMRIPSTMVASRR